ncbi:MAG TPA: TPM domain-containing protein, partial [Symbiobacteriaceae bacterium]|nr:TPM domain-containing protein [Symbiobacteriaceae bacterium]
MGKLVRILLVCAALAALLAAGPAWAARSPAGIVSDDSGTLSAGQLQALERDLTGLRYHYRVVILGQAFAGDQPADANARFSQLAHDLLAQREVPREAVLITIAMKERLVDFRVYADGPVNQAFLEGTGREFSAHTDSILDQFRGPAGRGDIPGGIVSAVKRIEAIVPIASPGPAPEPVPGPAPVPTPYPPPAVQPVPSPAQPRAPAPAPEPVDLRPVLWWLLGAAAVALAVSMGFRYTGYRKRLKATLAIRDGFLGDLLNLMEKEFPLARKYQGEETRGAVEAAIAAADEALHTQQEAEPFRAKAERSARFGLFGSARQALDKAEARYSRAAEQFGRAKTAWEPVSHCLRHWAALSEEAGAGAAAASSALTAQRVRTAWPLTAA